MKTIDDYMPVKPTTKKVVKKVSEPKVTLTSYTIKAVIPTGQYANIQPEITVNAPTLELAESYVMPYINGLIKQYSNCNEKEPIASVRTTTPAPKVESTPVINTESTPAPKIESTPVINTESTPAFLKAQMVVNSAKTTEAITEIMSKINNSKTLTDSEKYNLFKQCEAKLYAPTA